MLSQQKCYWVYILHCQNHSYYTGYTTDLAKRFAAHRKGIASKYTRSFKPICIAQSWQFNCKSVAMRVEHMIKNLSRQHKERLIANPSLLAELDWHS